MVRIKDDDPASRKKILAAAEAIFAERGFDGARVDDIALKAGVNKALIYYYFKSKDAILDTLLEGFMARSLGRSEALREDPGRIFSDSFMREYFLASLDFLDGEKDMLRIVVMESLKKNRRPPLLIKALEASLDFYKSGPVEKIMTDMRHKGVRIPKDFQPLLVNEFFTKSLPTIFFVLFQKAWAAHFRIEPTELREWFVQALSETHLAYHRRAGDPARKENHHEK